ncbi:hypothetical protein C0992_002878 [Termitomyces sp. T32_za158]|nr:hypothetical protein C0992_002878 [Termitomyces sp. T32_za158]
MDEAEAQQVKASLVVGHHGAITVAELATSPGNVRFQEHKYALSIWQWLGSNIKSNIREEVEDLVEGEEVSQDLEEQSVLDDAEIVQVDEPLMLQLGTVESCTVVQFGVEAKVKILGQLTYNMIIGKPFMHKNKVNLDFVNNMVVVNRVPLKAERVVLADKDGHLQLIATVENVKKELAPVASLPADLGATLMTEQEFQGTLESREGLNLGKSKENKSKDSSAGEWHIKAGTEA